MKLYLFGPLRLETGSGIRLLTGGSAQILGLLALQERTGYALARHQLAGLLWPDTDEDRARSLLSNGLYRLRQSQPDLGEHLRTEGDVIALQNIWIDVPAFMRLHNSPEHTDWLAALDLYTGDLLEDSGAQWAHSRRAELRQTYIELFARCVPPLQAAGATDEALGLAYRWTRAAPLDETAHSTLMQLLAEAGRPAAALAQFEQLTELLRQELDVAPSESVTALARTIRQGTTAPTHLARPTPAPLIGRDGERAEILGALDQLERGRGQVVLLEGEPGIGKTRLLEELASDAAWRRVTSAWGRASEFGTMELYEPLPQALQNLCHGPNLEKLRQSLPHLLQELLVPLIPRLAAAGLSPATRRDPTDRIPLQAALRALLLTQLEEGPLLILLDDLQWADPQFWELLPVLSTVADELPLLVLASYRDGELRSNQQAWQALRTLDRSHRPLRIPLNALSQEDSLALALACNPRLESPALHEIYRLSGGNPLVLRELALTSAASPSLEKLMAARLAGLDQQAYNALAAAAVLGRSFAYPVWQRIVGRRLPVDVLLQQRLLEVYDAGYRFPHDLVRAHVYRNLSKQQRRNWHERAAQALEEEGADPALLAWHHEQAADWQMAVYHHRRAAERALELEALETARHHGERLQQLSAQSHLDGASQLAVRCLLVQIDLAAGWSSKVASEAAAIAEQAEAMDQPETLVQILLAQLNFLANQGELDELRTVARRALNVASTLADPALHSLALIQVSYKLVMTLGDTDTASRLSQQAVELAASRPPAHRLLGPALLAQCSCALSIRDVETAHHLLQRALELFSTRPGLASLEPDLRFFQAVYAQQTGDWEAARQAQLDLVHLHRSTGSFRGLTSALYNAAHIAQFLGQFEEAVGFAQELITYTDAVGEDRDELLLRRYQVLLADTYLAAGRIDDAEAALAPVLTWLHEEVGGRVAQHAWTTVGTYHFYRQQMDASFEAHARALALAEGAGSVSSSAFLCYAEAAHYAGRTAEAQQGLQQATERIDLDNRGNGNITYYFYVSYLIERKLDHLLEARTQMLYLVNRMADGRLRRGYFCNMPVHRDIEREWGRVCPGRKRQAVARFDAPLGKRLINAERIEVCWTPDAGEIDRRILDTAGKTGLRRQRLQRLSAEAFAQGGLATYQELAGALGVSVRTIERDAAALAAENITLRTRRKPT